MTARCFLLSPTTMAWLDSTSDKLELNMTWLDSESDKLELKTSSWIHVDCDYISSIVDSALLSSFCLMHVQAPIVTAPPYPTQFTQPSATRKIQLHATKCNSMQLGATQCNSMKLNTTQCNSQKSHNSCNSTQVTQLVRAYPCL